MTIATKRTEVGSPSGLTPAAEPSDGAMLRLYREGREVAAMKCSGLKYPTSIKSLGIGVRTDDTGEAPYEANPYRWDGKLDEIAVFNDALTAEDVQKLANSAPR